MSETRFEIISKIIDNPENAADSFIQLQKEFNSLDKDYSQQSDIITKMEKEKLDLMLKQEQMLLQVKNRMPIEIAEKVNSWPGCLSAVAQLKQERNNADIELTKAQEEIEQLKGVVELTRKTFKIRKPIYSSDFIELAEALNNLKQHKEQDGK